MNFHISHKLNGNGDLILQDGCEEEVLVQIKFGDSMRKTYGLDMLEMFVKIALESMFAEHLHSNIGHIFGTEKEIEIYKE